MAQGANTFRAVLSHHLTWAAVVVVAGLEIAFFSWFRPSLVMAAAALGLGLVSLSLWPVAFRRSEAFTRGLYRWIEEQEAAQRAKLETLEDDFRDLSFEQGSVQIRMLREKLEALTQVLKRRLDAGEMTYGRYLGMAQEVYGAALDNLQEVAVSLRSISTIDPNYIRARVAELGRARDQTEDQQRQIGALRERESLLEKQNGRVAQLIAQNESAMTVIDQTAAALAATRTGKGYATLDAETAMAELEKLAKRVGRYAAPG